MAVYLGKVILFARDCIYSTPKNRIDIAICGAYIFSALIFHMTTYVLIRVFEKLDELNRNALLNTVI